MDPFNLRLKILGESLEGELRFDSITRTIYSTDASAYKEMPLATVWPAGESDIKKLLKFASDEKVPVTVRAAGTSLAGQVVSNGIIMDISRYMNRIIEINPEARWVKVQPGVVLDELNIALKKHGLYFGPETSTANRCNIGGMVGNNACGLHSLINGSTRDHTIELKAILSDGSDAVFGPLNKHEFEEKCILRTLEGDIYRNIKEILSDPVNIKSINEEFPDPSVTRRNTGYALDSLLNSEVFSKNNQRPFNFSNLLTGSEGTLAIVTEIKLNLIPLPPVNKAIVCVHLNKRNDAYRANLIALKYNPSAVEMMDYKILELTEGNITQKKNRFFVEGNPGAILIVEFIREKMDEVDSVINKLISDLESNSYGYSYPVVKGKDISKVWDLRKAGLGVLSNMKGDAKPVSLIEDTAVDVNVLPEYMEEFEKMLSFYGKEAVYHAHIATGELHTRPVLNLKDPSDVRLFRTLGEETAKLVKKYHGSISGEHGDGRLRGEFIHIIIGDHNYSLLQKVKRCWDPDKILNPGKITETPAMNTFLRYQPGISTREIVTHYDFSTTDGVVRAAENCNGSGDCRKSEIIGGLMCPSFMATRDEKNTTRARANILREFLCKKEEDPWDHKEIYEVLDLCLSCKGCKSECPSNVDIAKLKSEFMQHWHDKHGIPIRTLMIAYLPSINRLAALFPYIFNFIIKNRLLSGLIKRASGFARERSIPSMYKITLIRWLSRNLESINPKNPKSSVCLFIDEFTNFNDTETGIKAIRLLTSLNYKVVVIRHQPSARTYISKGLLKKAKKIIRKNIKIFSGIINEDLPLIGIEPSAILGFRDEYPDLAGNDLRQASFELAANCYLIDEFIAREFREGRISRDDFSDMEKEMILHTHCQQKSIAGSSSLIESLSIPRNFSIKEIPSGCCGMAGSFGYEKEHFELSNKIGELILFPGIRKAGENVITVAPGTSCRHHILDGTGKRAVHPVDVLYEALKTQVPGVVRNSN
jgi:FAD/FMN-containing dehydrogenase/Fe-S oxidoreductase